MYGCLLLISNNMYIVIDVAISNYQLFFYLILFHKYTLKNLARLFFY